MVTIIDDDIAPTPEILLSTDTVSFSESGGNVTVTLATSGAIAVTGEVTVTLLISGAASGGDYAGVLTTVVFTTGSTTTGFTIDAVQDILLEGSENITIEIVSVTGPAIEYGTQAVDVTIIDDDVVADQEVILSLDTSSVSES